MARFSRSRGEGDIPKREEGTLSRRAWHHRLRWAASRDTGAAPPVSVEEPALHGVPEPVRFLLDAGHEIGERTARVHSGA